MSQEDAPVTAAEAAAEAMRALAHATRSFDDPSDTSWAVGNVLSIASRFIQVLEQIADAHRANVEFAHDDVGRHTAGRALGLSAAANLHKAALVQAEAFRRIDLASQASGKISWQAERPKDRSQSGPLVANASVAPPDPSRHPAPDAGPGL